MNRQKRYTLAVSVHQQPAATCVFCLLSHLPYHQNPGKQVLNALLLVWAIWKHVRCPETAHLSQVQASSRCQWRRQSLFSSQLWNWMPNVLHFSPTQGLDQVLKCHICKTKSCTVNIPQGKKKGSDCRDVLVAVWAGEHLGLTGWSRAPQTVPASIKHIPVAWFLGCQVPKQPGNLATDAEMQDIGDLWTVLYIVSGRESCASVCVVNPRSALETEKKWIHF